MLLASPGNANLPIGVFFGRRFSLCLRRRSSFLLPTLDCQLSTDDLVFCAANPTTPISRYKSPAASLAPHAQSFQSNKISPAASLVPSPPSTHASPAPPKSSPRPN